MLNETYASSYIDNNHKMITRIGVLKKNYDTSVTKIHLTYKKITIL